MQNSDQPIPDRNKGGSVHINGQQDAFLALPLPANDAVAVITSLVIMMGSGKVDIDPLDLQVAQKAIADGRVSISRFSDPNKIRIEVVEAE